jgi:hypothetical protein
MKKAKTKPKSMLEQIKSLFEAQKFSDIKTDKGILRVEGKLDAGAVASLVTEDGIETPGAGAYTMDDGTIVNIDDSGKVASISKADTDTVDKTTMDDEDAVDPDAKSEPDPADPKEPTEDEEDEEDATDAPDAADGKDGETPDEEDDEAARLSALESEMADLKSSIMEVVEQMKNMMPDVSEKAEMKKSIKALRKENKELGEKPAVMASNYKKVKTTDGKEWNIMDYQKLDPKGLENIMKNNPTLYSQMYKEYYVDKLYDKK